MSSSAVTPSPVKSFVEPGETSATSIVTIPVAVQAPSPIPIPMPEPSSHSGPAHPPGLPQDDAYWRHLREMWDGTLHGVNSRRPSATSPVSPAFSDDASVVNLNLKLEDVDLRSATVQRTFRLNNLPALIKAQTEAANANANASTNKPAALDVPSAHTLPVPRTFAGRRTFSGVVITTHTTTRGGGGGGFHDPAPPYTPRASVHERSLSMAGYVAEQKEVSKANKWTSWIPSCKWLFWIGFIFPLLWALGAATLFLGVRHSSARSIESGTSKVSKSITQVQIDEDDQIQNDKRWAKLCAWAFAFALCVIPVIISIALIAPHLDAPEPSPTSVDWE